MEIILLLLVQEEEKQLLILAKEEMEKVLHLVIYPLQVEGVVEVQEQELEQEKTEQVEAEEH